MICDWMTVSQDHGALHDLEFVDDLYIKLDRDGTIQREYASPTRFSGSHSTSIGIKCHNGVVSFNGNIGRFGRSNNVDNLNVDQTKDCINWFMRCLGLPEFTSGYHGSTAELISDGDPDREKRLESVNFGAKVHRIDLTGNYSVGCPKNARELLWHLSGLNHGRQKTGVYGDAETITVGAGSRDIFQKIYIKSVEMQAHRKKTGVENDLIEDVHADGVVRYELELKQATNRLGVRKWEQCTQEKCEKIYETYRSKAMDQNEVITDAALESAHLKTYSLYKQGYNVRNYMSRATFYRHRNAIKSATGEDISNSRNRKGPATKVISVSPYNVREQYRCDMSQVMASIQESVTGALGVYH